MKSPFALLIPLLLASFAPLHAATDQKPNIVFVLVDDQHNTSLGCAGHPQIKTPVIDSPAARDDRYTYANYYQNGAELPYDRERDPTELTNVATDPAYAAVFAPLQQRSRDYEKQYARTATGTSDEAPPAALKKWKSKKTPKDN